MREYLERDPQTGAMQRFRIDDWGGKTRIANSPESDSAASGPAAQMTARLSFTTGIHGNAERRGITADSFAAGYARTRNALKLELLFNSPGGDLASTWQIIELMRDDQRLKTGIGLREISSAAGIAFLNCDLRYVHPDALFMMHDPVLEGGPPRTAAEHDCLATARLKVLNHFCSRLPHIARAQIDTWMHNATYFDAQDCVRYGLCDGILDANVWVVEAKPISLAYKSRPWHPRKTATVATTATPVATTEPTWKSLQPIRKRPVNVPPLLFGGLFRSVSDLQVVRNRATVQQRAGLRELCDEAIAFVSKQATHHRMPTSTPIAALMARGFV